MERRSISSFENVYPNDNVNLPRLTASLYIGKAPDEFGGSIRIACENGKVATFDNVKSGSELKLKVSKIFKTGTTVERIVALYTEAYTDSDGLNLASLKPRLEIDFNEMVFNSRGRKRKFHDIFIYSTSFPKTQLSPQGYICYQPHNLLISNEKKIQQLVSVKIGSTYTIKWVAKREVSAAQIEFCNEDGSIYKEGVSLSSTGDIGSYTFKVKDPVYSIRFIPNEENLVCAWMFVSDLNMAPNYLSHEIDPIIFPEGKIPSDFIESKHAYGEVHEYQRESCFLPRRKYFVKTDGNEITSSVSEGLLIEPRHGGNLISNSTIDHAWAGREFLYRSNLKIDSSIFDPAGQRNSAVLVKSKNMESHVHCPHVIHISEPSPCVISFFVKGVIFSKLQISIQVPVSKEEEDDEVARSYKERYFIILNVKNKKFRVHHLNYGEAIPPIIRFNGLIVEDYPYNWIRISIQLISFNKDEFLSFSVRPCFLARKLSAHDKLIKKHYFSIWGPQFEPSDFPSSFLPSFKEEGPIFESLTLRKKYLPLLKANRISFYLESKVPNYLFNSNISILPQGLKGKRHLVWWWGTEEKNQSGFLFFLDRDKRYEKWLYYFAVLDRINASKPDELPNLDFCIHEVDNESYGDGVFRFAATANGNEFLSFLNFGDGQIFGDSLKSRIFNEPASFCGIKKVSLRDISLIDRDTSTSKEYFTHQHAMIIKKFIFFNRNLEGEDLLNIFPKRG